MATSPSAKRQKSSKDVPYELIYWPGLPGRGEHIRLALEEAGAEYTDTAHIEDGVKSVLAQIDAKNTGDDHNPPPLAPPILKHGDLVISQTPNILLYLGPRTGLAPKPDGEDADGIYRINALVLTALDGLSNEVHDTHHPIATGLYYEDQKEESKRKAKDYLENRLPKFLGYFERVLKGKASGEGSWLYGGSLTYADLVLFQCVDGVKFAFPNALKRIEGSGEYKSVFELYEAVKERPKIKEYLSSDRRQKYSDGIYRHYPELDEEADNKFIRDIKDFYKNLKKRVKAHSDKAYGYESPVDDSPDEQDPISDTTVDKEDQTVVCGGFIDPSNEDYQRQKAREYFNGLMARDPSASEPIMTVARDLLHFSWQSKFLEMDSMPGGSSQVVIVPVHRAKDQPEQQQRVGQRK
ncbi:Glutathione S-transferase [Colletotrichum gloeosporioides]|uniref:Glutathione S-transferase n=1 Tax=Colletotrichum gloeosporioides TaxID=474922 RepID=A0A8H4CRT5_COLGL|nr:Glutathione S-transferase [Colletotrichum gloeosporioides]KAF3808662.1 Glutathione S-transferase [Colletotrichum gloeosporioides]